MSEELTPKRYAEIHNLTPKYEGVELKVSNALDDYLSRKYGKETSDTSPDWLIEALKAEGVVLIALPDGIVRCVNDTDGDGDCHACARNPEALCRQSTPLTDEQREGMLQHVEKEAKQAVEDYLENEVDPDGCWCVGMSHRHECPKNVTP